MNLLTSCYPDNLSNLYSDWLYTKKKKEFPKLKLYCFPFAGGNASIFRNWHGLISEEIELSVISLPGRWIRGKEEPIECFFTLISEISGAIEHDTKGTSFAFFGHSMGSLLAYEVACELRSRGLMLPEHLFLSAYSISDGSTSMRKPVDEMTDDEFLLYVKDLSGTPDRVLQDESMWEQILSVLKVDLRALDKHLLINKEPLQVPITTFAGRDDLMASPLAIQSWKYKTLKKYESIVLDGGHFFLEKQEEFIINTIVKNTNLKEILK